MEDIGNADVEMSDVILFSQQHQSPENVIHISVFSYNKVVNVIQTENILVRRTIFREQNDIKYDFNGMVETAHGYQDFLNKSESALYFHAFTAKYSLLRRSPEEWLMQAND